MKNNKAVVVTQISTYQPHFFKFPFKCATSVNIPVWLTAAIIKFEMQFELATHAYHYQFTTIVAKIEIWTETGKAMNSRLGKKSHWKIPALNGLSSASKFACYHFLFIESEDLTFSYFIWGKTLYHFPRPFITFVASYYLFGLCSRDRIRGSLSRALKSFSLENVLLCPPMGIRKKR